MFSPYDKLNDLPRIFIGYDKKERISWHVLAHSIIERSSRPVSITAIGNDTLGPEIWEREKGDNDSTDFSNARWMIPHLCNYQGFAIFMDCDMVCNADIAELWDQRDQRKALVCKKHSQEVVHGEKKFLGSIQAAYDRKNWSSLMVISCDHPYWKTISPEEDHGLDLHRFVGLEDNQIGSIYGSWNHLLKPGKINRQEYNSCLSHFTWGGPWHGWTKYWETELWTRELSDMLGGDNPCAYVNVGYDERGVYIGGAYHVRIEDAQAEAEKEARIRPKH